VLLVPSSEELRSDAWVREAAALAGSVAPDGLVVLGGTTSRSLQRALAADGFEPAAELLHVPDLRRSRYVVILGDAISDGAMRRLIQLSALKRLAVRALLRAGWKREPLSVSTVLRRSGDRPMLEWLVDPGSCVGRPAVIARSWRDDGALVARLLGRDDEPAVVAKVGGGAAREAIGLVEVAAGARTPSVAVPRLLESRRLGGHPAVVATGLAGPPAAQKLQGGSRRHARKLLASISSWLATWNAKTASPGTFDHADADRHLLGRADRLAPLLEGGDEYVQRLRRQCELCHGERLPFVAAHNDLTAANLLLSPGGGLGIVDWEESETSTLPLGDLVYAAADLAAALDGYRDRPSAFRECYAGEGSFAKACHAAIRHGIEQLELSPPLAEICFHACWLMHADNERRRSSGGTSARPFLEILRAVAAGEATLDRQYSLTDGR
jgi:hypothetical protein